MCHGFGVFGEAVGFRFCGGDGDMRVKQETTVLGWRAF